MNPSIKISQKSKGIKFVLRPYRRVPSWHAMYYMTGDTVGKGVVTNLSQSGFRVQGEHALEAGIDLSLRVVLSEAGAPIEIQQARVQWVNGCDFGVKIVRISPLAAKQITHVLATQLTSSSQSS
jgi:PilZ domain